MWILCGSSECFCCDTSPLYGVRDDCGYRSASVTKVCSSVDNQACSDVLLHLNAFRQAFCSKALSCLYEGDLPIIFGLPLDIAYCISPCGDVSTPTTLTPCLEEKQKDFKGKDLKVF